MLSRKIKARLKTNYFFSMFFLCTVSFYVCKLFVVNTVTESSLENSKMFFNFILKKVFEETKKNHSRKKKKKKSQMTSATDSSSSSPVGVPPSKATTLLNKILPDWSTYTELRTRSRSEERRVGKECRSRWS